MSYSSFASVYDELTQNVDYKKRAEYIASILADFDIKDGLLLDLACGTGEFSTAFASIFLKIQNFCFASISFHPAASQYSANSFVLGSGLKSVSFAGPSSVIFSIYTPFAKFIFSKLISSSKLCLARL